MSKPIVSVVFRAYNCERYISQAIESILSQTFQDFEIVVVDDASTDRTPALLQAYAQQDVRIKVITNKTNQGPVRTMNISLQHARGEFIAVHDSDDISLPHRLETQVKFLQVNPHIALVGGGAFFVDEEGEVFKIYTAERKVGPEVRQYLERGRSFIHTSVMYRRKGIQAIGLYDEFFLSSHDYDVLIRMADIYDTVYYEEPLVKWRCLSSGVTGTKKRAQAAYAELARIRSNARKEGESIDLQQEFQRLMDSNETSTDIVLGNKPLSGALYYYNIGMMLLDKGKREKARQRFIQSFKHKGSPDIYLRVAFFYLLSFLPNGTNSKPIQILRKAL